MEKVSAEPEEQTETCVANRLPHAESNVEGFVSLACCTSTFSTNVNAQQGRILESDYDCRNTEGHTVKGAYHRICWLELIFIAAVGMFDQSYVFLFPA